MSGLLQHLRKSPEWSHLKARVIWSVILTYHREQCSSVPEQLCLDVMAMAGVQAVQQVCKSCTELTFLQGALTTVECSYTSLDLGKMRARRSYASKRYDSTSGKCSGWIAPNQSNMVYINACYASHSDGNSWKASIHPWMILDRVPLSPPNLLPWPHGGCWKAP